MFDSLNYKEKICKQESIKKILSKQNLVLNRQIQGFDKKSSGESIVGYWLLFFLVGGYMKDSLKDCLVNFSDFHFQGINFLPIFCWILPLKRLGTPTCGFSKAVFFREKVKSFFFFFFTFEDIFSENIIEIPDVSIFLTFDLLKIGCLTIV